MGAAVAARQHIPGNREHVAALFERASCGDERPALLPGFDDDDGARHAADDSVSQRKEPGLRRRARHELADDGAARLDLARERRVLRRVQHVDSRTEHGDGGAARQRAAMRRGIDAACQPAHDDDAARGEIGGDALRDRQRVRRSGARADDRDGMRAQRVDCAAYPNHRRWVDDRRQRGGITRVAPRHRRDAVLACAPNRRRRARMKSRSFVRLFTPMSREKVVKNRFGCVPCAQSFGGAQPAPRREKGQRDDMREIGHGYP